MSIISSELLSSHIEKLARLLTETEASEFLSCSQKVLQKWRYLGGGPPYVKRNRLVRYRLRDLIAWSEAGLKDNMPEPTTRMRGRR